MTSNTAASTEVTVTMRIPKIRAIQSDQLGREWDSFLQRVPRHPSFAQMTPDDVKRELERSGE